MNLGMLVNLAVVAVALVWLARRHLRGTSLASNVLIGLVIGAAIGAGMQAIYGTGPTIDSTIDWINIVGSGYVNLLQMIVMPLVLVAILSAISKLGDGRAVGKISAGVLGMLMFTTAVSAMIGIGMARLFRLRADGIVAGTREVQRGIVMEGRVGDIADMSIPDLLLSFIPRNIFADLSGARDTSIIAVVIFASLLGFAVLALRRENEEVGERVIEAIDSLQHLVMKLVRLVIRLTPYGVLALMTRVVATSDPNDILNLIGFVIASYVGLLLILGSHAVWLAISGINPVRYYRKIWPVLTFAFSSRSSAATIPLNIESQINRLGVSPAIANFSASFGATIGQNGCAGLYPAMLAVMIAPSAGVDPSSLSFMLMLILVTTLGSFGIAGVGGGATFAAILVLSTMNLPVALAGLLISIEPLIDMGRTAINVNGAMTAGAVTSRWLGQTNLAVASADDQVVPAGASWSPEGEQAGVPVLQDA